MNTSPTRLKKAPQLLQETVPDGDSIGLEDILPYLAESADGLKGSVSPGEAERFYKYEREPDESTEAFNLRVILDSLSEFYEVPRELIMSPFTLGSSSVQGLLLRLESQSVNYAPCLVTLDFPPQLQSVLSEGPSSAGCRFAVIGLPEISAGKILVPDLPKHLGKFFHTLPKSCEFQDWNASPASSDLCLIFDSYLVAPASLFPHFAVDCLDRLLGWLREQHAYQVV